MKARLSRNGPGVLETIASVALWIAGLSLVVMTVVEFWQVFARYVINDSPSWTEPVALFAMKCAMMFGAAAGVHSGSHFGFYMAVQHSPPTVQRLLTAFSRLVMLGTGLMLTYWGAVLTKDGWDISMAGVALPEGAGYLPVSAGGALIALFAAAALAGRTAAGPKD